jgi:hypothetical protein
MIRPAMLVAAGALAGCYATGEVTTQALRAVPAGLEGPRLVQGERLDPGTMIRADFADGSRTGWFAAADLRVSTEGLMVGDPRPAAGARAAPGVHWSEVRGFHLRSLAPGWSALTVPFFPFVLLASKADPDGFTRAASLTEGESTQPPPPRLWSEAPSRPLFTSGARRRFAVRGVATADVQASYRGDLSAGLTAGLRFQDFYELAFVSRSLSIAGTDPDGGRSNVVAFGGAMGLHVDPDGDGRFAFYLGGEVVGTSRPFPVSAIQLKWGPRFHLGHHLFLTISPLNPSQMWVAGPARSWRLERVVSSIELGGAL